MSIEIVAADLPIIHDDLDRHVSPLAKSVEVDLSEWAASILNYTAALSENHDVCLAYYATCWSSR